MALLLGSRTNLTREKPSVDARSGAGWESCQCKSRAKIGELWRRVGETPPWEQEPEETADILFSASGAGHYKRA